MTTQQITPTISLKNIENEVLVKDMNYEFHYRRLIQPDLNPSDLFALHYREQSMERWVTCNGCLSHNFTIAKTEDIMRRIQTELNVPIIGEHHFRSDTTVKVTFLMSDFNLELPQDNQADKIIFKLITNMDADIEVLGRAGLSFNIINGFSGNHALQLNYGFMKSIYGPEGTDGERKSICSNNPFLLDEYTHRLIHDSSMAVTFEEVANIRNNVTAKIELFKNIPILDAFIDLFTKSFPAKFVKKFNSLFEDLPSEFKNMYYISFIFGILIDAEKKINLEIKLRSFIKEYIADATAAVTN